MENKNTRNIILGILGVAILGGIGLYFSSTNTVEENLNSENDEVILMDSIAEFGDITKFVKTDLTDEQKEDLKIILEQRKDRQIQIKDILDEAYEKGDMEGA
jgi:DNA repair protein RadC